MKLEDCTPGTRVYIAGRYLLTQLNSIATVLGAAPPRTPAELLAAGFDPRDDVYPKGMVQVRLADGVEWSCREPFFGPEDLAPAPEDT